MKRGSCFVITAIGANNSEERRHTDLVLNYIIRPALKNYDVTRADEIGSPDMITDRVIGGILDAELAVADLSFLNPNVFYELGLRHMTEKPVILMAREGTHLPFDTAGANTIFFRADDYASHQTALSSLAKAVEHIEQPNYTVSTPVTQYRGRVKLPKSADSTAMIVDQAMARMMSIIEDQSRRSNDATTPYRVSKDGLRVVVQQPASPEDNK